MSFLASMLGLAPKRPQPKRVPTDEVVPMHLFDDTSWLRGYTLIWTFRFDDVLDADMLCTSLSELFQTDGWRKLGGRLRQRVGDSPFRLRVGMIRVRTNLSRVARWQD
jgi:hypothetical protein